MLAITLVVLLYIIPIWVWIQQAIKHDSAIDGHITIGGLLIYVVIGLIPLANIVCMILALYENGFFDKKIFVGK
jgi:hypothetical protein